ncbi:outer membrane protein transport protein [Pendulispora brunnea]|uniref:Outer membrane protein transport protein n=1 Tax=Pendulispora brunnea TaxID=2905690 RepID=A0ABZ2KBQ0_9BACT
MKRRLGVIRALALAAGFIVLDAAFAHSTAQAGGLNFSDRGVKPLSRGGAWVAGADDVGAVWYNPAGLADAGTSLMADFAWLNHTASFTRKTQVIDGAGTVRVYEFPTVTGKSPVLPIPTLGGSYNWGKKKQFTVAGALYAPYTAITSFPTQVDGQPAPQRYSLISLDGSALVNIGAWFAWKPIEQIRLGIGLGALVGTFTSTVFFNANPADRLIGAPEDPNYDSEGKLTAHILTPVANLGATFVPVKYVRIGLSYNLPIWINAPGDMQVRLPTAVLFDKATVSGEDVRVKFKLPGIFRAGIEVRPIEAIRAEVSYVREFWGIHDEIEVRPENIGLNNVTGFPSPYYVPTITLPRHFQDSNSIRVGAQGTIKVNNSYKIDLRAGFNYDQSAIPTPYLSPLTIDMDKYTVSFGGSLHVGDHWRLDAVYARIFAPDQEVSPAEAAVPKVNPVRGNPTATESINGGSYTASANVFGVGVNYRFK